MSSLTPVLPGAAASVGRNVGAHQATMPARGVAGGSLPSAPTGFGSQAHAGRSPFTTYFKSRIFTPTQSLFLWAHRWSADVLPFLNQHMGAIAAITSIMSQNWVQGGLMAVATLPVGPQADDTPMDMYARAAATKVDDYNNRLTQIESEVAARLAERGERDAISRGVKEWLQEDVIPELLQTQKIILALSKTDASRNILDAVNQRLTAIVSWANLTNATDGAGYAAAMDDRIASMRHLVGSRIDSGEDAASLLSWYDAYIIPETKAMAVFGHAMSGKPIHDANNRLMGFMYNIQLYLQQGRLDEARRACEYHGNSLAGIVEDVGLTSATTTQVELVGFQHAVLAPTVDTRKFYAILQNQVINGGDKPAQPGVPTPIRYQLVITAQGTQLVYTDKGAGMSADTMKNIRVGERVHNGALVDVTDPDARGHGYGWRIIAEAAAALGITWEITSQIGEGTVVHMNLPPGLLEPNPASYIVSGGDDMGELQLLINQMPEDRRLQVMDDMTAVGTRVVTELLLELSKTPGDYHPKLRQQAQETYARYTRFSEALYLDIRITAANAESVRQHALNAANLSDLLKRLATYVE